MVISQQYVDVPVGDRAMRTFVAAPRASGSYPGAVFYSDVFQFTESTLRWCIRLAGHGFVVAAPEIYHRIAPAGTVLGSTTPRTRGR
jgi:carboxymethylenebutenolidase